MADLPPYPGAPRWVKISGIAAGVLVLLVILLVITGVGGLHGPGRHVWSGEAGGQTPLSGITRERTPHEGGHQ